MDKKRRTFLIATGQTGKLHREERAEKLQDARENADRLRRERVRSVPCNSCKDNLIDCNIVCTFPHGSETLTVYNVPSRVCRKCGREHRPPEIELKLRNGIKKWIASRPVKSATYDYSDL